MIEAGRSPRPRYWPRILGIIFILLGVPQIIGGAWLLGLGGSPYYLPAGVALLAAGVLLCLRRVLGAWIYCGFFLLTVIWSVWEVGLSGWGLLPRVFGLALLMIPVLWLTPRLE